MKTLYATAFVSLALFLLPAAAAEKDEVLLDVRIVGSSSGKPEPSFGTATGKSAVQRLLLDLDRCTVSGGKSRSCAPRDWIDRRGSGEAPAYPP